MSLLKEFKEAFEKTKKDLNFKATYEELEEVFYLEDFILHSRFVSPKLSRAIALRQRDTLGQWQQALQRWTMPQPYMHADQAESSAFTDEEKQNMIAILHEINRHLWSNTVAGLKKDKQLEAEFIDQSLALWNKHKEFFIKCAQKASTYKLQE